MLPALILALLPGADAPDIPKVHIETGGLYDAPRVSPLPWDQLPPTKGRDGGIWIPIELHMAMTAWWVAYEGLADVYQVQLDELEDLAAVRWEQGLRLGAARERARQAREQLTAPVVSDGWITSWLRTVLWTVAGVAVVSGAFVLGWVLSPG